MGAPVNVRGSATGPALPVDPAPNLTPPPPSHVFRLRNPGGSFVQPPLQQWPYDQPVFASIGGAGAQLYVWHLLGGVWFRNTAIDLVTLVDDGLTSLPTDRGLGSVPWIYNVDTTLQLVAINGLKWVTIGMFGNQD